MLPIGRESKNPRRMPPRVSLVVVALGYLRIPVLRCPVGDAPTEPPYQAHYQGNQLFQQVGIRIRELENQKHKDGYSYSQASDAVPASSHSAAMLTVRISILGL